MRQVTYICNRCGEQITGKIHKLLDCIADPENGHYTDEHYAFNLGTSELDFCELCMVEVDRELYNKYRKAGGFVPDKKKKEPEKKTERRFDMGKIQALRKAGWSLKAIAEEMGGCSPQTIANKLHALEVANEEGDKAE